MRLVRGDVFGLGVGGGDGLSNLARALATADKEQDGRCFRLSFLQPGHEGERTLAEDAEARGVAPMVPREAADFAEDAEGELNRFAEACGSE